MRRYKTELFVNGSLIEEKKHEGKTVLGVYLRRLGVPQSVISGYDTHSVRINNSTRVEWDYV